jgi:hypothetical protein
MRLLQLVVQLHSHSKVNVAGNSTTLLTISLLLWLRSCISTLCMLNACVSLLSCQAAQDGSAVCHSGRSASRQALPVRAVCSTTLRQRGLPSSGEAAVV